ncbi:hypothetical protein B6U80_01640 [Candidatus Pacearchaeota archaeon ex4484_26]|nr:MAG: hypothetical protein B6U80_01640 [Candidatus Pacearchaeota archaeon ex4484_26]
MKLRPLGKKGITISMPTIIITILALLVLVIVALSFTMGMDNLVNKIKQILGTTLSEESARDAARQQCEMWCNTERGEAFCNGVIPVQLSKDKAIVYGCQEIPDKSKLSKEFQRLNPDVKNLGVNCPKIDCSKY